MKRVVIKLLKNNILMNLMQSMRGKRKSAEIPWDFSTFGTPGVTRTHYIPLRRRTLYPGEVRGLVHKIANDILPCFYLCVKWYFR